LCTAPPFFLLSTVLTVSGILSLANYSKCSVSMLLDGLSSLNTTDLEAGVLALYTECSA
jgi:hypothetical protein